jgi:carbonic anhydrase
MREPNVPPPPLTRRDLIRLAAAATAGATLLPGAATAAAPAPALRRRPDEELTDLVEGNKRFMSGQATGPRRRPEDFAALAQGQNPTAVVLSCSDSRVPPELVFDQGVGDLFVVRVAGNVVVKAGFTVKGSIEYAVAELGTSLIMVLGHSGCGAIKAAIQHIDAHDTLPGSINELVDILKPVVARVRNKGGDLLANAIRANVEAGVDRLNTLAPVLAPAVKQGRLKVVGGVYDLATGAVTMVR